MDNKKIILALYVAAGVVVWYLSRESFQYLYLKFYQIRRLPFIVPIKEFLPVVLWVVTFITLLVRRNINTFVEEVIVELRKVSWPNKDEVRKATLVVLIWIAISGTLLAVFDLVWGNLVTYMLKS